MNLDDLKLSSNEKDKIESFQTLLTLTMNQLKRIENASKPRVRENLIMDAQTFQDMWEENFGKLYVKDNSKTVTKVADAVKSVTYLMVQGKKLHHYLDQELKKVPEKELFRQQDLVAVRNFLESFIYGLEGLRNDLNKF